MDSNGRDDFRVLTDLDEVVDRRVEGVAPGEKPRMIERVRHASSKRVQHKPIEPIPIDRWTVPTVTARLRRMSAIYARLPMSADIWPADVKSAMPKPILDRSQDYAPSATFVREPLRNVELDLADRTLRECLKMFKFRPEHKAAFWGVALGWSWRECAQEAHAWDKLCREMSHTSMGKLMIEVAQEIADDWNERSLSMEEADVELAKTFHRNRR